MDEPEPIARETCSREHFISFHFICSVCNCKLKEENEGGGWSGVWRATWHRSAHSTSWSRQGSPSLLFFLSNSRYVLCAVWLWNVNSFIIIWKKNKNKIKICLLQNLIFVGIWVFHSDHITFIKDVAATQPPQHLCHLLRMLKTKGGSFFVPCVFFLLVPRFFWTW